MNPERRWFSAAETIKYFGLKSAKTLYSQAARKQLPPGSVLRIGKQLRFDLRAIEASNKEKA